MTVSELIERLQKVHDQNTKVSLATMPTPSEVVPIEIVAVSELTDYLDSGNDYVLIWTL